LQFALLALGGDAVKKGGAFFRRASFLNLPDRFRLRRYCLMHMALPTAKPKSFASYCAALLQPGLLLSFRYRKLLFSNISNQFSIKRALEAAANLSHVSSDHIPEGGRIFSNVRFRGNSRHRADWFPCPLLTKADMRAGRWCNERHTSRPKM
jgi:hypothetical protein